MADDNLKTKFRFVILNQENFSIKSKDQFEGHYNKIGKYFKDNPPFSISIVQDYDNFMLLDGDKIAAYVKISIDEFFRPFGQNKKKYTELAIYNFCIIEEYRGKGLSHILMDNLVNYYKKIYKKQYDTILTLHISYLDDCMPIAAKIYYSMGFTRFAWVKNNAGDFSDNFDLFVQNTVDLYQLYKNFNLSKSEGHFLASFCFLGNYKKQIKKAPKNYLEIGEVLRKEMLKRSKTSENI